MRYPNMSFVLLHFTSQVKSSYFPLIMINEKQITTCATGKISAVPQLTGSLLAGRTFLESFKKKKVLGINSISFLQSWRCPPEVNQGRHPLEPSG